MKIFEVYHKCLEMHMVFYIYLHVNVSFKTGNTCSIFNHNWKIWEINPDKHTSFYNAVAC